MAPIITSSTGSVLAVANKTGSVINSYSYDPFGNTTSATEQVANPLRFDGQYLAQATGFYKMGARFYVSGVSRWMPLSSPPRVWGIYAPNFVELLQQRISPLLPAWQEAIETRDVSHLVDLLMKDPSVASVHSAVREQLQNILMDNAHAFLDPPLLGIRRHPAARERLPESRAPTLVIVGGQDRSNVQEIASLLEMGIPSARKVVLPSAYHMVNMEQPEEFNRVVLDFLRQVEIHKFTGSRR